MPRYNLVLAYGGGRRDRAAIDSGERELRIGDQIEVDGRCWELVDRQVFPADQGPEHETFLCGPCRPYAIFTFDGHTAPILQRDVAELDRGLRNLYVQETEAVRALRAVLAQAHPDASLQIGLGEEEVSELYRALFAMQVEGPLSGDLDELRVECYRYLDDRGHFPHEQVPPLPSARLTASSSADRRTERSSLTPPPLSRCGLARSWATGGQRLWRASPRPQRG